jgi:hypothetical protein
VKVADIMAAAQAAVGDLESSSEDDLYRLLAIRLKAMERDPQRMASFAPKIQAAELGIAAVDLVKLGRTAFGQLAGVAGAVICAPDAPQGSHLQRLLATFGTDVGKISAAIATVLIGQLAMAPAVATIVATLVVGKIAPTSVDALCRALKQKSAPTSTIPTPTTPTPTPTPVPPPPPPTKP